MKLACRLRLSYTSRKNQVVLSRGNYMPINGKTKSVSACPGPIKRREFLRIGLSGFATLSLPGLLQLRARAAGAEKPKARTAVILVWLRGGASHLETYDPKPDAPSEFRGIF